MVVNLEREKWLFGRLHILVCHIVDTYMRGVWYIRDPKNLVKRNRNYANIFAYHNRDHLEWFEKKERDNWMDRRMVNFEAIIHGSDNYFGTIFERREYNIDKVHKGRVEKGVCDDKNNYKCEKRREG